MRCQWWWLFTCIAMACAAVGRGPGRCRQVEPCWMRLDEIILTCTLQHIYNGGFASKMHVQQEAVAAVVAGWLSCSRSWASYYCLAGACLAGKCAWCIQRAPSPSPHSDPPFSWSCIAAGQPRLLLPIDKIELTLTSARVVTRRRAPPMMPERAAATADRARWGSMAEAVGREAVGARMADALVAARAALRVNVGAIGMCGAVG